MKKFIYIGIALLSPLAAFAQTQLVAPSSDSCFGAFQAGGKLGNLFEYITCLIESTIIPLIFAIAVMLFVWGVVNFFLKSDDAEQKEKGRQFMLWGIIAFTVMVGVWGLVKVVGNTFGINTSVLPQVRPNSSAPSSSYNQNPGYDDGQ